VLVRNPGWNVVPEEPFTTSACHDFSHFVTVQCRCGEQMHMHQTAWERVPETQGIASKWAEIYELRAENERLRAQVAAFEVDWQKRHLGVIEDNERLRAALEKIANTEAK